MFIVKHKKTGFKHYFDKDQYQSFYKTTGKTLIKKGQKFTDVYSTRKIKECGIPSWFTNTFALITLFIMITAFILGYIHYSTI